MKLGITVLITGAAFLAACEETTMAEKPAMAEQTSANQAATSSVAMPTSLSRDERTIWNSLTEAARRDAAVFIGNGGTLTQFVAI